MRAIVLIAALLLAGAFAAPAAASPPCQAEDPCGPEPYDPLPRCVAPPNVLSSPTGYAKWLIGCGLP